MSGSPADFSPSRWTAWIALGLALKLLLLAVVSATGAVSVADPAVVE
jgi:hypothetical protein